MNLTSLPLSPRARSSWEKRNDRLILAYMLVWSVSLLLAVPIAAAVNHEWDTLLSDLFRICTSPSKLVTDYFAIGGLASALLNAGLCGLAVSVILLAARIDPDARMLAGYFLVIAHCFYGLNFINMWPPFLGVLVFSLVMRRRFRDEVHFALFATSLGPFISDFLFRYTLGDAYVFGSPRVTVGGVLLSVAFGIASGFVIPALLPGTTRMHRGFNLYKAGLAIGLFGVFAYAFLYKTLGITEPETPDRFNPDYALSDFSYAEFMLVFFAVMFLGSILAGFLLNGKSFRGYRRLFYSSGHDMDFSERYGTPLCMVNYGVYGFAILAYLTGTMLLLPGVGFTGPTVGVVIAALTFAAAGQTVRNVWPIAVGFTLLFLLSALISRLCGLEMTWTLTSQGYINGLAFATGLCPFAGKYGRRVGVIAGFLDAVICTSTAAMHGGFVLYNGGFAAGLTALALIPVLDFYKVPIRHPDEPEALSPQEAPDAAGSTPEEAA